MQQTIQQSPILFLKDLGYVQLLMDKKGQTWLFWSLTEKQQIFLGLDINPFVCFWKYDLCEQHLKRLHLTCLTCKLRRVVSGRLSFYYPIRIHQIWFNENDSTFRKLLQKNVLSLAEVIS